jgi:translation elongation factor EF-1alpha
MEMERQATVTQTRVQRFIELQTQVNNLIDSTDGPTDQLIQLTGELELLGDSLNDNEIHEVVEWYNANNSEREMEYEDVEWMIE